MSELDAFLDRMTALLSIGSGPLTVQALQSIIAKARETEPATHWSPWLEWRGGPCPLPVGTSAQIERPDDGVFDVADAAALAGWDWAVGWKRIIRFRYHSIDPAGWLPRGKFIPPAELWDEGCPVRVHIRTDNGGEGWAQHYPRDWDGITHIRLVARQPQAELPEGWSVSKAGDLVSPDNAIVVRGASAEYLGKAAILEAVAAWAAGDGR